MILIVVKFGELLTSAMNSSKNNDFFYYECFEKLYQTLERVFHQISKHFKVG